MAWTCQLHEDTAWTSALAALQMHHRPRGAVALERMLVNAEPAALNIANPMRAWGCRALEDGTLRDLAENAPVQIRSHGGLAEPDHMQLDSLTCMGFTMMKAAAFNIQHGQEDAFVWMSSTLYQFSEGCMPCAGNLSSASSANGSWKPQTTPVGSMTRAAMRWSWLG